jgi:hypothetical protein
VSLTTLFHCALGEFAVRIAQEFAGDAAPGVDDGLGIAGGGLGQGIVADGNDDVAAEQQPGFAGGDAHVGHHGAALLRQAGHVEHGDALAVEVGGHAEQGADGDHAGAADAGDEDAVGLARTQKSGSGAGRRDPARRSQAAAAPHAAAMHRDDARAEALLAGVVLVAGDWSMARLRPNSVSTGTTARQLDLCAAVAAAFADGLVDEEAARRVDQAAALAAAALFGGAGLVVDDGGDTGAFAHLALHGVEFVAVADRHAGGKSATACRRAGCRR